MSDQPRSVIKQWSKNRRSERLNLHVPVLVYRRPAEGPLFYEATHTLTVSAHGALIPLTQLVASKQLLWVQNTNTGEQKECRVVSVETEPRGLCNIAVEFTRPVPKLWSVAYPPADWEDSTTDKLS